MGSKADAKRVLIAAGLAEGEEASFVTLPDPKTGQPSTFLLGGGALQEVNWVKSQFSCWFVGDSVLQDGGLYVCTPVDLLFVALPLLERARGQWQGGGSSGKGMFCDLEQILQDVDRSTAQQLTSLLALQLPCVCDCRTVGGQEYFRLNDTKALAWLAHKVRQAKAALLACPSAAGYAAMEDAALTAYGAGMLGEYISAGWAARLAHALGLQEDGAGGASGAGAATRGGQQGPAGYHPTPAVDVDGHRAEKRPKLDPKEAAKQKAAEARAANKTAKLAKEASTMRKLSSFFAPRPAAGK